MKRPTLLMTSITILLLFALAGCIVDFRPDGDIFIDFPPFAQGSIPANAMAVTTTTITATTVLTDAPGTIPPVTVTVTAAVMPTQTVPLTRTPPLTSTATMTATLVPTGTRAATATTPSGTPTLVATAPTAQPTNGAATPAASSTPTQSTTPSPAATASPTTTPSRTLTPSPTRTPTGTPTRTATATGTATSATPPATPTAIPGTVFLGSHQGFVSDSSYVVVGEVINGEQYPVFRVKVIGSFYDSAGNLVAAQESLADLTQIEPELSSPVKLQVANSGGSISRYELTLVWDEISVVDYEELTILSEEMHDEGGLAVFGELRNDGSVTVKDIVTVVTFYDSAGAVVDVYQGKVSRATLAPHETTTYNITIPNPDLAYDHFRVQAQGALQLF